MQFPLFYHEIIYLPLFCVEPLVWAGDLCRLLCHKITYPLLFLHGTFGVGGEEICAAPTLLPGKTLLCQEITYPLLFLRGTSGEGGEEICAAAAPLPGNHLSAAVPAWNL